MNEVSGVVLNEFVSQEGNQEEGKPVTLSVLGQPLTNSQPVAGTTASLSLSIFSTSTNAAAEEVLLT